MSDFEKFIWTFIILGGLLLLAYCHKCAAEWWFKKFEKYKPNKENCTVNLKRENESIM